MMTRFFFCLLHWFASCLGITNYPIGVGINSAGEIAIADNHNNFNLTIFSQDGQVTLKHSKIFWRKFFVIFFFILINPTLSFVYHSFSGPVCTRE